MARKNRANRRKLSQKYFFSYDGQMHSVSAGFFWFAVRSGFIARRNDCAITRVACVSDKFKPIFDHNKKRWNFIKRRINPIKINSILLVVQQRALYLGKAGEWMIDINDIPRKRPDHPVRYYSRLNVFS